MAATQPIKRSARGLTIAQRDGYLAALRDGATVKQAAESVGRHRGAFEHLRRTDEAFSADHDDAYEEGGDVLEREAFRRAVEGCDDVKVVGAGAMAERVEFKTYSDRLLELLLKARRPHRFRENVRTEHVGGDGPPIRTETEVKGVPLDAILDFAKRSGAARASDD